MMRNEVRPPGVAPPAVPLIDATPPDATPAVAAPVDAASLDVAGVVAVLLVLGPLVPALRDGNDREPFNRESWLPICRPHTAAANVVHAT